jgi:aryl-alcohol dehydrogenase-like predicted oxidoreductase
MQSRTLGRSGLKVSAISLGSWLTLGTRVDEAETTRLVQRAFDLGITTFDTADVYQNGDAERALGQAVADLPRHQLVLATKCFFAMSEGPNDRGLSRKHVTESVEASLRRLGTDYLDLHQCHRNDPETPLEETVRAYEDLIRQGKLLYWGVSQWPADRIEAACEVADAFGAYRPISNQPEYSILARQMESGLLGVCERLGLGQMVFSPLAQGTLTGKYSGGQVPQRSRANDPKRNRWMGHALDADKLERIDGLRPWAEELGLSMAQFALAWCLRRDEIASTIIGATSIEQLEENAAAAGHSLPEAALDAIDQLFPPPGPGS